MNVCLDVSYVNDDAVAAALAFRNWSDEHAETHTVVRIKNVEPYQSGQFFRRELPCLLSVLCALKVQPAVVIIDGYVWLGSGPRPGLGARLYEALERRVAVVGVAKTRFPLCEQSVQEIFRGRSRTPLYITA